jgi:diguanylate cyclase (GGDEF)-like protein
MNGSRDHHTAADGRSETDSHTDGIDLSAVSESGLTQNYGAAVRGARTAQLAEGVEANIILIAHPEGKRLGMRYRLSPEDTREIGRSSVAPISLPEVLSVSRQHARLVHRGDSVVLEDLGSTNGTYINGRLIEGAVALRSGDRFQVGAVHFKFLHELDVEHAYYEAIYDLVTRDGLTDIFNKRKYSEEVERELARAHRHHRPLCMILLDLDDFKKINDTCGHLCGDFVLKHMASAVKELLRPEQLFARIGGDEFVILAPETGLDGAATLAEKIRSLVAGLEVGVGDTRVAVTCSIGVAQATDSMETPDDLFATADRALYESKHGGGNRVTHAADDPADDRPDEDAGGRNG